MSSLLEKLARDPRVTVRRPGPPDPGGGPTGGAVVYWMQRAQRAHDNPALDVAIEAGNALGRAVVVFLGIVPFYPRGNARHYQFLVDGIPDLAEALAARGVGFVLRPWPDHHLAPFCEEVRASMVVGDENPLREPASWRTRVAEELRVPLVTVDADVVVPTRLLLKEQFAARTIRPRIHKLLPEFLVAGSEPSARVPFRAPSALRALSPGAEFLSRFSLDRGASPIRGVRSGPREGQGALDRFVRHHLPGYATNRNHPELDGTSRLSAYLHFGHLGPRGVALAVKNASAPQVDIDAYLEELIVRRELAINFVHYNPRYDSLEGCEPWAKSSLALHAADPRPHLYTEAQLEAAATHDPLWNAAQTQMMKLGWMHGYMRMYWAKKILEWTPSAAEAFDVAARQNDKWFLCGRDPNGYTGVAWAVGGKHDRAWGRRPIFGTIRYMSYESTSRKFDSRGYIRHVASL